MFLQMLKDEFPDVRLHIISKLELVNKGKIHATAFFLEKKKLVITNRFSHRHRPSFAVASPCHCPVS